MSIADNQGQQIPVDGKLVERYSMWVNAKLTKDIIDGYIV